MLIVEEHSLLFLLLEQRFDLSVLKLDDLLPAVVDEAAERGEQDASGLEQERYIRRRKSSVSVVDG